MKKLIVIFFLFLGLIAANAQSTWYVSYTGSDDKSGLSAKKAFKTLQRLSEAPVKPGDSIRIERGGTYFGTIKIPHQRIFIKAYGLGTQKPIISGLLKIDDSKWKKHAENIWKVYIEDTPRQLYSNGKFLHPSRTPDKGYFTDKDNADHSRYEVVRYRPEAYFWSKQPAETYQATEKPYYLEGSYEALTMPGEWYFKANVLFLYSETSPKNIEASVLSRGVSPNDWNPENIRVEDLKFVGQYEAAVWLRGYSSKSNIVMACEFERQGLFGIEYAGVGCELIGNRFKDVLGVGIEGYQVQNSLIASNHFKRIGLIPGHGRSGWDNRGAAAISIDQPGPEKGKNTIMLNSIDSVGWSGIQATMDSSIIEGNLIRNSLLTLSDGGAIYIWGNGVRGTVIKGNTIEGCIGNIDQYPGKNLAYGIYCDERSNYTKVIRNTIRGVSYYSIVLNSGSHHNLVSNNLIYGPGINLAEWQRDSVTVENRIEYNVIEAGPNFVLKAESNFGTECMLGSYRGNRFSSILPAPFRIGNLHMPRSYSLQDSICGIAEGFEKIKEPDPDPIPDPDPRPVSGKLFIEFQDEAGVQRVLIGEGTFYIK